MYIEIFFINMKSELLHSLPCIFRSHSFIGSSLEAQSARRRSKSTSMASSVEVQSTRIATMFSLEPVCLYMLLYITIYYYMLCSLYCMLLYVIVYHMLLYIMDCYGRTIPDLQIKYQMSSILLGYNWLNCARLSSNASLLVWKLPDCLAIPQVVVVQVALCQALQRNGGSMKQVRLLQPLDQALRTVPTLQKDIYSYYF